MGNAKEKSALHFSYAATRNGTAQGSGRIQSGQANASRQLETGNGPVTFLYIALPKKSAASPSDTTEAGAQPTVSGNFSAGEKLRKPVVLIAEDTDSNFMLFNAILRKEFEVHRALDGVEAVDTCRELNPDLILMDIQMPRMDGLQATGEIRRFNTGVPVLAVTAFAYEEDRLRALAAGCNDYLTKPIIAEELRTRMRHWLKKE